jgi:hypothetical protein
MPDDPPPARSPEDPARAGLRGWLSDILFPTLIEGQVEPLVTRLGGRSTVDHPLFGRASGLPPLQTLLVQAKDWLAARRASYVPVALVIGTDRDVAEGTLTLALDEGPAWMLPVAVVAERRRSREVELRIYHATSAKGLERADQAEPPVRDLVLRGQDGPSAPPLVVDHLAALRKGDAAAVLACFESDAFVRDALGVEHRHEGGGIRDYYAARYGVGVKGETAGADLVAGGYADDGRACAIELTRRVLRGEPCAPHAMLAVYERGKSGLFHALRLYEASDR